VIENSGEIEKTNWETRLKNQPDVNHYIITMLAGKNKLSLEFLEVFLL
jgi:hypothetical protein